MDKCWTFYATVTMGISIIQDDDETQSTFEKWLHSVEGLKAIEAEFRKNLRLTGYPTNAQLDEVSEIELKLKEVKKRG
jgi:hypothetical protein